ncbi:pentatricopeptide repeat-containing protein [Tanacetum coccineum]
MAAPSCNDLVFEVKNDGVTGDGMSDVNVGGGEEVIVEDVISDDGANVGGGEEANINEEVRVRKVLDKVIEENDNPSLMDGSGSEIESDFGTDNPNQIDAGMDYNMYSDSESDYSDRFVDYLSDGEEDRLYEMGDSETLIEHMEFMDDLLWKLRGDGCETTYPFQLVDTKVEKYPIHDEDTNWKVRKPKIVSMNDKHTCTRSFKYGTLVNYKWIGKNFGLKIRQNPEIKLHDIADMEGWKLGCRRIIALDDWFLKNPNAGEDLNLPTGNGLTLMSDQHKGLIEAIKDVMPYDEHPSKASYPELFKKIMDKIKRTNPNAHQYLIKKDLKTWSRAFFRIGLNCDAVKNGFSECFNYVLLRVRNKPLITMLEAMRVIMLERMNTMRQLLETWTAGGNLFKVRNGSDAFKFDESLRTCNCCIWRLSRISCPHVVPIIFKLNRLVEDYIRDYFRKEMYIQAYSQYLAPVDGMSFWPECEILAFVNVAGVEGSNAPEVEVDNVGHVRGSSVEDVRVSGEDNIVQTRREKESRVKLVHMRGDAGKGGQISRGRPGFGRLGAWFWFNHGDINTFDENQNLDLVHEPETQQSEPSTSSKVEKADQTTNDSATIQATPTDHPRPSRRATSTTICNNSQFQVILRQ